MTPDVKKIVTDYKKLKELVHAHKVLGHKVVATIGSWDMLHIGHLRYLNNARAQGNVLIVGVDTDRGIKLYKKTNLRPIIPESERMEMLSYQHCVDYVTLIDDVDSKGAWQYELIKDIPIDTFVVEDGSYSAEQKKMIKKHCKQVVVLNRQAQRTSSTDIVQNIVKTHLIDLVDKLRR
ncbi:MAG: hypothetical protein A2542_02735 [Parcubacteria group bacterium RIFOXYD2_FULL_52_8]|nr:MAG: hypothetical protein A2542_02735 [Parcubacteria group bacterium RIFOXYD2_FULL_52_8]